MSNLVKVPTADSNQTLHEDPTIGEYTDGHVYDITETESNTEMYLLFQMSF